MPSLKQITEFRKNIRKSGAYKNNSEILYTYYKLAVKKSLGVKQDNGTENLFNISFSYLSFPTLVILYDEIFAGLDYYFECDEPKPYIIDCGSNIGMSVLFFKYLYPDAKIDGFEPDDSAYEVLKLNSDVLNNVYVHKKAVTDYDGSISFFTDPDNEGSLQMSLYESRESEKEIKVECISLADFIDTKVDFLKIDIEGAELTVFKDLDKKDKLQYIEQMVIEYHHHIDVNEDSLSIMLGILEKNNYGYQIRAKSGICFNRNMMQDIIIYAYKK